jgi:hypothetical protein
VKHTYHRQGDRPANHLPANTAPPVMSMSPTMVQMGYFQSVIA